MARAALRIADNVEGPYFVDETCIDCDLCRQIAPATFARADRAGQSAVVHQPASDRERTRAAMALVTCPTSSIGTTDKRGVADASRAFPELIEDDVYFSGYASESSYGASSYFIKRPRGNVLVDSPRAAKPLLSRLAELGGVKTMLLTHRDDVADHEVFARELGAERILHVRDLGSRTQGVERRLEGDDPIRLDEDLLVIPVPGHTRGSIALLYKEKFLFSGDHVWADEDRPGELEAGRGVCWYSWPEQIRSMKKLAGFSFSHVLPGHGRKLRRGDADAMRAAVLRLTVRMRP